MASLRSAPASHTRREVVIQENLVFLADLGMEPQEQPSVAPPSEDAAEPSTAPAKIERRGLVHLAACAALLVASKQRIPFSCSAILTTTLIENLVTERLIERSRAEGSQLLRYDRVAFKWICEGEPSELMVRQFVRARAATYENEVVTLWAGLATCELQDFLGCLLRRHGLPTWWSNTAFSAATDLCDLSLSQMRYVMWYAVRAAASTYLVSGGNEDQTHADLQATMRRQADYLATGVSQAGKNFLPARRHSALLTIFLEDIAPIGTGYWTLRPVASSLRGIVGAAGAG